MRRRDWLLGSIVALGGCAAPGVPGGGGAHPVVFFDAARGTRLAGREVRRRARQSPLVLMGEMHDNLVHHEARAALLRDWLRERPERPAAVVFEQLDREHDDALAQAQRQARAGAPGEERRDGVDADDPARLERLLDAARFDRQAWRWPAHRPLFEAALAGGARWIAANFSRASARRLRGEGGTSVDPALQAVVESARWDDQAQAALERALLRGHCDALPAAALPAVVRAQRLRDAALALPLLDAAERRSVLVAGNGHVRRDFGVPRYLGALEREALVIGFEELEAPGEGRADAPSLEQAARERSLARLLGDQRAAAVGARFDLVALTAPRPGREDPCRQLRG
ncbi:MAG: ChaN family lipoprotein [Burkholderiaceae bacterium]|nr:ChaN family lipoprotein [Burkholderiaceae bacterium]